MSEHDTNDKKGSQAALIVIGAVLVLIGLSTLGDPLGLPNMAKAFSRAFGAWRQWSLAIAAIVAGVLLIVTAARGGVNFRVPTRSDRLYRSPREKMISGVIGGLAEYLGMDPTVLRLAVVAFALLVDAWPVFVVYVVASIVVPVGPPSPPEQDRSITSTQEAPPQ